ncbi:MAG: hypothetical protein ABJG68_12660 [Crocinitomicaceae bacterium]
MRFIALIFLFLISINCSSQLVRFSSEPYIAMNYVRSVKKYEPSAYSGLEILMGLKVFTSFGNRFAISAGIGHFDSPAKGEYLGSLTARYIYFKNYKTGFYCFVEAGLEKSDYDHVGIPFYLGTKQNFGKNVSFNFRLRIPTLTDIKYIDRSVHYKVGLEAGLEFQVPSFRKPKPLTVFGNPFILN